MSPQTESERRSPDAARTDWTEPSGKASAPKPPVENPAQAIREAMAKLGELREFAAYYVASRLDALRASVRRMVVLTVLALLSAVAAASMIVVAVVYLLRGVNGAWALLFPHTPWAANLITAATFLVVPVCLVLIGMRVMTRMFKSSTVHKYETRKRRQREQFGVDVAAQAGARRSAGPSH